MREIERFGGLDLALTENDSRPKSRGGIKRDDFKQQVKEAIAALTVLRKAL
jgi:hypothetical protein